VHSASLMSDAVPRRIAHAALNSGSVHSIYRSVVNITTADGLLAVASPEAGGLPNGILADLGSDWRMTGLQPGMVVRVSDVCVRMPEAGLEIRLEAAQRWSPRFPLPAAVAGMDVARWRRRAAATRAIARDRARGGGFGSLLGEEVGGEDHLGAVAVAGPIVVSLIAALQSGDRSGAAEAATGLIGLGPGLTPSGDDVLVGIEAALHALAGPMAGFLTQAVDDVEDRTTALAATLLRHAAAGEFAQRLHTLLEALLGSADDTIAPALDRAIAWGATSGTDCLLGVLIGLDVAAGIRGASD
jgi:Protein of unknown function (DUF2877)